MTAVHAWVWTITLLTLSALMLSVSFWIAIDALVKWARRERAS